MKNALLQYDGTLVVVSHDRDFLCGLTDELYEFRDGAVHDFRGDIMEFMEARYSRAAQESTVAKENKAPRTASSSKVSYEQNKAAERERRRLQNVVRQKEQEVEAIENELAAMDAQLASGEQKPQSFYDRYQQLKRDQEQKMDEWEQAVVAAEM